MRLLVRAGQQPWEARLRLRSAGNSPTRVRDGWGAFPRLRGRCALGSPAALPCPLWAPPRAGGREVAARGAGARQVEPWGAAAAACRGSGGVASGAPSARCGAARCPRARTPAGGMDGSLSWPRRAVSGAAAGGRRVRAFPRGLRGQAEVARLGVPVTPRLTVIFLPANVLLLVTVCWEKDEILGVVCLNYRRTYKSIIAKIIQ